MEELRSSTLECAGVAHGFLARERALSERYRAVRVRQVHGSAIVWADGSTSSPAGEADAVATEESGVAVAIATADCVPLLLAAPEARVVAAVHAGWRGSLAGIVPAMLAELRARRDIRAAELRVAIGPAIDGCCFEIERAIAERFADRFGAQVWRAWRDGSRPSPVAKGTLDLRLVNRRILIDAGVKEDAIELVGPCTYCGGDSFASYRREGPNAGRQLSWIALDDDAPADGRVRA